MEANIVSAQQEFRFVRRQNHSDPLTEPSVGRRA